MAHTKVETDFLYVYGVILTEEIQTLKVPYITGIDQREVEIKIFKDLTAVVTPVSSFHFSQEQIDLHLKDADWLKEKAFHHHDVISAIHMKHTVLPMSFCTIFQNEDKLGSVILEKYDAILQKLLFYRGKQEWNIKVFCNRESALSYVIDHNVAVVELKDKLEAMPKGKQFLMRKKLEHLIATEMEMELSRWWHQINDQLKAEVTDTNLRDNWGREVTNRKDDMIINCDYLIEVKKVECFLIKLQELEKSFQVHGCTFQVTGPCPPYHFSRMVKE